MSYEKLSLMGFVNEMRDVSDGPHPRRFCFILGAGASRTSGIKSGQELVKLWDKELQERNPEAYENWKMEQGITEKTSSSSTANITKSVSSVSPAMDIIFWS